MKKQTYLIIVIFLSLILLGGIIYNQSLTTKNTENASDTTKTELRPDHKLAEGPKEQPKEENPEPEQPTPIPDVEFQILEDYSSTNYTSNLYINGEKQPGNLTDMATQLLGRDEIRLEGIRGVFAERKLPNGNTRLYLLTGSGCEGCGWLEPVYLDVAPDGSFKMGVLPNPEAKLFTSRDAWYDMITVAPSKKVVAFVLDTSDKSAHQKIYLHNLETGQETLVKTLGVTETVMASGIDLFFGIDESKLFWDPNKEDTLIINLQGENETLNK